MNTDKKFRSVVKALSWRFFATSATFIISYFVTGSVGFAMSISLIEVIAKLLLYYLHERVWQLIDWRQQMPMSDEK